MKLKITFLLILFSLSAVARAQSAQDTGKSAAEEAAKPATDTVDAGYVIASSDVLTITVWNQPAVSGERLVRPDGKISIPLLGDIQTAGLKPMELADLVSGMLKKFMIDPKVSVTVSQVHRNYVYLLGEVGKRGPVDMAPGMTFLEAISTAGGLTDFAKKSKIYILRNADKGQQRLLVNYKKALKGEAEFNIALAPGDTIVVP